MLDNIKKVLKELSIENWKIYKEEVTSTELFFIRQDLDMNRAKSVHKYQISVYRDFTIDNIKYRGSALVTLSAQVSETEMKSRLEKAYYAASFVKNPWYPLAEPEENPGFNPHPSCFAVDDLSPVLSDLRESLYRNDTHKGGGINSAEIFVNCHACRIVTSTGIDKSFPRYQGDIELICDWHGEKEDVEIYNMFSLADLTPSLIESETRAQIENCRLRSAAQKAPEIKDIPIILTGDAVQEMVDFYLTQSSARGVYEKIARGKVGELFQAMGKGDESNLSDSITGDKISITLEPSLPGSPYSVPYDKDGTPLRRREIFKEGRLLSYHGNLQYAHYLGVLPTGNQKNRVVAGGNRSVQEWKAEPHVEIRNFSDFQMDPMTGDFGGEVRLALWFDGEKTRPLTGASISACLFEVQKEIYLSTERVQKEGYDGPAYLMYPHGHLVG